MSKVYCVFAARCTMVCKARSCDCMSSVCLSVTVVDCDHIGWISWKLIARTISPTPSLFVAQRPSTHSQGNTGKFWGDWTIDEPTCLPTTKKIILGIIIVWSSKFPARKNYTQPQANFFRPVYIGPRAHRAVIFVIAQLSCIVFRLLLASRPNYRP